MRALPQAARWYLISLWCVALFLFFVALLLSPLPQFQWANVFSALIFAVMLAIADFMAFQRSNGREVSIAVAVLIAGLTVLPLPLLLLVIILGTISPSLARDTPWWQILSIIAARWLMFVAAAGIAFLSSAVDPQAAQLPYTTLPALVGLLLTGAVIYAIEQGAEAGLLALSEGQSFRASWRGRLDDLQWYALMLAPLGGLLAMLWSVSVAAFVLGLVPIIIVQRSLRHQVELNARNSEVEQLATASSALNSKLERLQSLAITLIATRDIPTMLETLCNRLAALLDATTGWVVLLNEQQVLHLVAWYNLPIEPNSRDAQPAVPWPQSYEPLLSREHVVVLTDQRVQTLAPLTALADDRFWNALIVIPLVVENRVLGAICLAFGELRGLNESERRILTAFARQAAMVLENVRLFRKLQESQAELIQSSKLAAVGTFAAGIAHEFNNLLAGMLGYAQLGLASTNVKEKNESLKVVVDTCKRGKSITGSLLTFARRQEPRRELGDVREAVEGTLTLMELELRKCSIVVERQIQAVPPTICDLGQISQVFLNLLTNARDAMKPDGGRLTVELSSDDGQIVLSVRDTGCGIPDSIRDKIFEPFVTTKGALGGSQTPGTGLGLSVSYGIVKEHGGTIVIESAPNQGTSVMVRLPIVDELHSTQSKLPSRDMEQIPPLRILVVDDDPTIGSFMQNLLERTGHQISVASNGAAALERYRSEQFDMVLTDLSMPGINGVELVRALRSFDPEMTVMVFTGQALEDQVEQALAAGAVSVLRKPFELHEVLEAIRVAWHQRKGEGVLGD